MPVPKNHASDIKFKRAVDSHGRGQLAEAERLYSQVVRANPKHFPALFYLGACYAQQRKFAPAADSFAKAAKLDTGSFDAQFNCGLALQYSGKFKEAAEYYGRAVRLDPHHLETRYNYASALAELKRFEEALENYDQAIRLKPGFAETYFSRANALRELERFEEALVSYDRAISLKPDYREAHYDRALTLFALRRFEEALGSFNRAIELDRDYAQAHCGRGAALIELKCPDEALESLDRAIRLKRDYAEAHSSRGTVLFALKRFDEALASLDRAVSVRPDFPEAHFNRGIVLHAQARFPEALKAYDRAIALDPDYAEAYRSQGNALNELKRFEDALRSYEQAIRMNPTLEFLSGTLLHTKMKIFDWKDYNVRNEELHDGIQNGEKVTAPFPLLALSNSPAMQRKAAEIWSESKREARNGLEETIRRPRHERLRIGYFSADFYHHATSYLIAELIEKHDRTRFEWIAFSFGPETNDDIRQRLKVTFDKFIDVRHLSDRNIVSLARSLDIDIAIDLNGATEGGRTAIFAMRAAPIQVGYLGYPGTLGADYIDYLIADHTLIPISHRQYYSEKIAYLPDSYQPNDRQRPIAEKMLTRTQAGLPEEGFVFCSFNNGYKITPDMFDSWMRILGQVEDSVLWLLADHEIAMRHLKEETRARNIDPDRLVFAPRMELGDHLARHRLADLFLDTLPCTAHTTASDALWMGLPLLTQIGETFAGRVAASLLNALNLPELVTTTRAAYEASSIELATHPAALAAIKRKLDDNRRTAPLFDTERLARHIETAFVMMDERYQAGLPPEHLDIAP